MAMSADQKLSKAIVNLIVSQPFYGALAVMMDRVPMPADWFADKKMPPTAATNGRTIYYCEEFIDKLSLPQVVGELCHLSLHVGMLHHTRRGERDNDKWQAATDYAVNQIIKDSNLTLPPDALLEKKFEKMSAEEIFRNLPDMSEEQKKQMMQSAGMGTVMDFEGTESEKQQQEADWKSSMAGAVHRAKMAGKLPAGMERLVDQLLEAKVNWADQLMQYLTDKERADDDWCRPNRRFVASGLYLPTVRENPTGELVVAVDTSGSICDKTLQAFATEIRTIATEVNPTQIVVIYCDAAINRVQIFERDDEICLSMCGGGGTDFRPPFDHVKKKGYKPHAFVYLTDGYGPFPDGNDIPYPVVWCMITDVKAPFGHHVRVNLDDY